VAESSESVNPLHMGWRRSSFCSSDTCVEITLESAVVLIRNSRDPEIKIAVTHNEWQAFLAGVKNFEFEFPVLPQTDGSKLS
jgi:hypothetical protein